MKEKTFPDVVYFLNAELKTRYQDDAFVALENGKTSSIFHIVGRQYPFIKIGLTRRAFTSESPFEATARRLKGIQTGCPVKVNILHAFPVETWKHFDAHLNVCGWSAYHIEAQLHAIFASENTFGEWFSGPEITHQLKQLERVGWRDWSERITPIVPTSQSAEKYYWKEYKIQEAAA